MYTTVDTVQRLYLCASYPFNPRILSTLALARPSTYPSRTHIFKLKTALTKQRSTFVYSPQVETSTIADATTGSCGARGDPRQRGKP